MEIIGLQQTNEPSNELVSTNKEKMIMESLSLKEIDTFTQQIIELNTFLEDETSERAISAFNMGCLISGVIISLLTLITLFLSHWISAVLMLIFTIMIAFGISSLLASKAKSNYIKRRMEVEIQPKLNTLRNEYDLSIDEFNSLALTSISEGTPLYQLIETLENTDNG